MKHYSQQGFTLIELVMVIVILGILSAVALPKFANMQQQARYSLLLSARGAVSSAMNIVYAKSVIEGKETAATANVELEGGVVIDTVYGYPSKFHFVKAADLAVGAKDPFSISSQGGTMIVRIPGNAWSCKMNYSEATSATASAIVSLSNSLTADSC